METYRDFIEAEFKRRRQGNARYTMGAFSKQLGVPASQLHDILNKRYGLSRQRAQQIADKLKLSQDLKSYFCDLVEAEHARSDLAKKQALERVITYRKRATFSVLERDRFALIADPIHFALLELTYIEHFKPSVKAAALMLHATEEDILIIVQRLQRLGLLEVTPDRWRATEDFSQVGDPEPNDAVRSFHHKLLMMAQQSLADEPMHRRENQSLTLALASEDLPEAKAMVSDFMKKFCKKFSQPEKKDSVYTLSLQLFPWLQEDI